MSRKSTKHWKKCPSTVHKDRCLRALAVLCLPREGCISVTRWGGVYNKTIRFEISGDRAEDVLALLLYSLLWPPLSAGPLKVDLGA